MNSKIRSRIIKFSLYLVSILSTAFIIIGLLSLIHDVPRWYMKNLNFPRIQLLIICLILLVLFLLIKRKWNPFSYTITAGLTIVIIIHFYIVSPFLIGKEEVLSVTNEVFQEENSVSILLANILMTNRNTDEFLGLVKKKSPDILLVMEVDNWWTMQLRELEDTYQYSVIYPLDNAYGMALYSKLPLRETEVKFINHSRVPSIHTQVVLPSGKIFKFYAVHPVAPFPSDKYPTNIGNPSKENQKEVELIKIGNLVSSDTLQVIVAGDYNDVPWSANKSLFEVSGKLKDVRKGRGLYNTFSAHSTIMRWPLDHFFVTDEILVSEFELLGDIQSDHFPLYGRFMVK